MLRERLIDEASGKCLVGQLTSAIVNPCHRICASIWLSKTKSSELPSSIQLFQDLSRKGAIASVIFGKLGPQQNIL